MRSIKASKYIYEDSLGGAQPVWIYAIFGCKYHYFIIRYEFYSFSLIFFAKLDLLKLRNTPTKIRWAALSQCGVMRYLAVNIIISL